FRVPIQAGGATSNLLVPLYLVVAVGALAWLGLALGGGEPEPGPAADASRGWGPRVERLLAVVIVLHGLQAIYSSDFERALQNMVFFYAPFTLLYVLLRTVRWTPEMIRRCLL